MNRTSIVLWSLVLTSLAVLSQARAAAPRSPDAVSQDLKRVLTAEALHTTSTINRRTELQPTLRPKTASDAEWWQAGFVKVGNSWVHSETAHKQANAELLEEYRAQRNMTPKTAEGHAKLANWCQDHKLDDQERAHLLQVIVLSRSEAERAPIFRRMGYRKLGQHWLSPAEIQELQAKLRRDEERRREWQPSLERIVRNWSANPKQHKQAQEELKGIEKPAAIPSLLMASTVNETLALAICEQLDKMPSFEASQALAFMAVQSEWPAVRQAAIKSLKERRVDDFAPALLGAMHSPLLMAKQSNSVASPRLIFREDADRFVAIDLRFLPGQEFILGFGNSVTLQSRLLQAISLVAGRGRARIDDARLITDIEYEVQVRLEEENDQTEKYNQRAAEVLAAVTGQEFSSSPHYWWAWWHLYTATQQPPKDCVIEYRRAGLPARIAILPDYERPRTPSSCLTAGVPVATDRGLVAIELIRVGDRVLAKNTETGEVDYKPVVHTTTRDPVPVKRFTVGGTSIVASDGHHFWSSGTGWAKTRDLKSGTPIHTSTGMSRVELIEAEPDPAQVYNLVVADFHTYFVGRDMILSHDVLQPALTNAKVPGLDLD